MEQFPVGTPEWRWKVAVLETLERVVQALERLSPAPAPIIEETEPVPEVVKPRRGRKPKGESTDANSSITGHAKRSSRNRKRNVATG